MHRLPQPRVFFFLGFLALSVFAGCGGGGGGGGTTTIPGGGGGVPTPTPTVPAAVVTVAPIQPNALPTTTGTLPPAITSSQFATGVAYGQYVYSAAGKINFGTTTPMSTITDTDTSGKTCLVYEPANAASATPCPLAHATSSVTLTSSNDQYAILYNGQPVTGAAVTLNVSSPSTSYAVPILGAVSLGNLTFAGLSGPVGTLVLNAIDHKIYAAIGNPMAPLTVTTYSAATGYSAPSAVSVSTVNGNVNARLTANGTGSVLGGAHDITFDGSGNIWMAENNGPNATQYVAVYAANANVTNAANGSTITQAAGVFAEYQLLENDTGNPKPLRGITWDGTYIWVIDNLGEFWRINPSTATVYPNQGTSYVGTPVAVNAAHELTAQSGSPGSAFFSGAGFGQVGNLLLYNNSLWVAEDGTGGHILQITPDTTALGTGNCTANNPCLGYYTASTAGQNCPSGIAQFGGNLYVPDCITSKLVEYSPTTLAQTAVSTTTFPQFLFGGVGQTSDGWFWTVTQNGLEAIQGMNAIAPGVVTPSNAACNSVTPSFRANGFITGPDGTLLYSPANPFGNVTSAPVCGLVY